MSKVADKDAIKSVYVICSKDSFLLGRECDSLLDKLLPPEQRSMALYQPETDKADIADVLDELRTLPFLADRRVVLIRDADKFISTHRPVLEKYFDDPCSRGVLVLTVASWAKNTRLAKKLSGIGQLIDIAKPKRGQLGRFITDYAIRKYNKTLARPAVMLLMEITGDEPGALCAQIDKLAIYVNEQKTITAEHIERLIGHNRMFNAFEVIDSVTGGQIAPAIVRLRNMFATDKKTEFTVVGAFAFHFRRLFNAKAMLEKGLNPAQVAGKLGIWYNKESFFGQLGRMTLKQIGTMICELARIDYEIKTGQTLAKVAIEQLVYQLGSTKS